MAVSVLRLDLAPPTNFWRTHHVAIGWSALALGGLILAGSLGFTWMGYQAAAHSGKLAGNLNTRTRTAADAQARVLSELRGIDVAKELPRWRLAERIFTERSLPWSRLTAELERSLVQDVRLKSVQRNRGSDRKVQLKIKGEARSREAEAEFVQALEKNPFFEQVILEREGERQGGGVEFDYTLAASSNPPPYVPLPKYGPPPKHPSASPIPGGVAGKAGAARPAPAAAGRPGAAPAAPAQGRGVAVPPAPQRPAPTLAPRSAPQRVAPAGEEDTPQARARRDFLNRMNPGAPRPARPQPAPQEDAP
ncbi:MAG: PilN domain-containing protein [Holophaga sp.]|jgi:hypothetical protein